MSRTDDLRQGGAKDRIGQGGGGPPFLRWSDDYAWVEGRIIDFWTHGKYGDCAVFRVTGSSGNLEAKGKDEDGTSYVVPVETGMELNVGLSYKALEGSIVKEDGGKSFHVAFEGWQTPKDGGDQYRVFAVLEIDSGGTVDPNRPPMRGEPDRRPMPQSQAVGGGPGAPGAEGPPPDEEW